MLFNFNDKKIEIKEKFKQNLKENSKILEDIKFFIEFLRYKKQLEEELEQLKEDLERNTGKKLKIDENDIRMYTKPIFGIYKDEDEAMQSERDKIDDKYSDFCYSLYYN